MGSATGHLQRAQAPQFPQVEKRPGVSITYRAGKVKPLEALRGILGLAGSFPISLDLVVRIH